ncbi:hypothetical protein Agub_g5019, partial [Astrephomene gubernaculifera]
MASASTAAGVHLATIRRTIDGLLADVGSLLADLTSQEHPTGSAEDEENEEARRPIDVALHSFWDSYYDLKRRHEENALSVAVLALTKSGKSTLLNALMGAEVLPMNNVPETARIVRITHDPTAREPHLRDAAGRTLARGEAAVRSCLQQLNSAARQQRCGSGPLSPQPSGPERDVFGSGAAAASSALGGMGEGLCGGVGSSSSAVLTISAPLVALCGEGGYGADLGRVTLLDTPGPNEAGEEQLKYQVERLLEGVDCVLYLLDYTKLKTAEEEGLFRRLRAVNPQLVERLSSRLFFVINKVDACETSEGLDPEEVRAYVADLVTRQLGAAGAPPPSPLAVPPSSSAAASGLVSVCASSPPAPASLLTSPLRGGNSASAPPASPFTPTRGAGTATPFSPTATAAIPPPASPAPSASPAPAAPFRLRPEQVLLLSGRNALLARLVLGGRAAPEAAKRFQRLAFGAFGALGFGGGGGGRGGSAGPSQEQLRAAAGCLLEGSGVCELEGRVLAFLAAHAASVKALATADDTARLLVQVRNVALAVRSCLHRNVAALQAQAEALRGELAEAAGAVEEVRQRADAVQAEVVAEIKTHLNTLRRRLFTHIIQTLDTDTRAPPPPSSPPSSSSGSSSSSTPMQHTWARVREKFLSMFTATSSGLPPHPPPPSAAAEGSSGGAGGSGSGSGGPRVFAGVAAEARSRSREELQALLRELHDDLMGQIHSEVYDFWGVLEACAASRHAELLGALNSHLAALAGRVEGAVSEALQVTLAPADIRLRPPSAEELHSDVQALIDKGIRQGTEKHIRVGSRTTTERVLRHPPGPPSLCRWGGYWVEVPRSRTVVETYTATVYSLKPDEIANHFIGLVDSAVTASEQALGSYVGALVEQQLAAARERIREYGDRYLAAMSAALAASSRGAESRSAALAAVEGYLGRLEGLAERVQAAQREAEAAVPGGAAGLMDEVEVYEEEEGGEEEEQVYGGEEPAYGEEEEQLGQQEGDGSGGEQATAAAAPAAEAEADGAAGACAAALGDVGGLPTEHSRTSIPDIDEVGSGGEEGEEEEEEVLPELRVEEPKEGKEEEKEAGAAAEAAAAAEATEVAAAAGTSVFAEPGGASAAAASPGAEVAVPEGAGGSAAVPSLRYIAGAVVDEDLYPPVAPEHQQQLQAEEEEQQQQQELEGGADVPLAAAGPAGGAAAGAAPSALAASGLGAASYPAAPFDYGSAFLRAMASSEMSVGGSSRSAHQDLQQQAAGEEEEEEPLTMIPLTA